MYPQTDSISPHSPLEEHCKQEQSGEDVCPVTHKSNQVSSWVCPAAPACTGHGAGAAALAHLREHSEQCRSREV